jgi:hypothetical protein
VRALGDDGLTGKAVNLARGRIVNQPSDNMPPNYPYATYPVPPAPAKRSNTIGLIGLIAGIVGFIFACIPGALVVGWVLLPIALILGIVGVCQSGKSKGTSVAAIIISIVGIVVGVVVFFAVVSDAFKDAFSKSDLSAPSPASTTQAAGDNQTRASNQAGSRDNPFPIGQTVTNDDWQITPGTPHEAGAEIAAENQFNDPPKTGMEYWIVPITAVYTGDKTGNLAFGITVKFVGSDNVTYDDRCGVIPNPLSDVGDLYKGGTAKGNVCVAVPVGADGLWTVATGFGDPAFFASK